MWLLIVNNMHMNTKQTIIQNGFTLVELLLVIAIMMILTVITVSQFTSAQRKARDAQRKADLGSVQRALEMYVTDHGLFPETDEVRWGEEFSDVEGTVYMKVLPSEPFGESQYCYTVSVDQTAYGLFALLENCPDGSDTYSIPACSADTYCWATSSPNTTPSEAEDF